MEYRERSAAVGEGILLGDPLALEVQADAVFQTDNRLRNPHAVADPDGDEHVLAAIKDTLDIVVDGWVPLS